MGLIRNLFILLILYIPGASYAAGLAEAQDQYNSMFIKNVSSQMQGVDLSANSVYYKVLIPVLFILAIFISVKNNADKIVEELFKISMTTYLVLACIGDQPHPFENKSKYLAEAVFLGIKDTVTIVKNNTFGTDVLSKFDAAWEAASASMEKSQRLSECGTDQQCIASVNAEMSSLKTEEQKDEGMLSYIKNISNKFDFFLELKKPTFWLFLLVSILTFIYKLANFGLFIMYTLCVASGLFLFKLIVPFAIIPEWRGKVIEAFKVPLSFALWDLLNAMFLTLVIVMLNASVLTATEAYSKTGAVNGTIIIWMSALSFVAIIGVHLVSIKIIPQLSLQLMNLSFTQLVNIVQAALSMAEGVVKSTVVAGASLTGGVVGAMASGFNGGGGDSILPPDVNGNGGKPPPPPPSSNLNNQQQDRPRPRPTVRNSMLSAWNNIGEGNFDGFYNNLANAGNAFVDNGKGFASSLAGGLVAAGGMGLSAAKNFSGATLSGIHGSGENIDSAFIKPMLNTANSSGVVSSYAARAKSGMDTLMKRYEKKNEFDNTADELKDENKS